MGMGAVAGATIGGAALSAGAGLLGAGMSSSAAKAAQGQSLQATYADIALQRSLFNDTQGRLYPYTGTGYNALAPMQGMAMATPAGQPYLDQQANMLNTIPGYQAQAQGYLNQAAGMNPNAVLAQANLEQTPGYQFTLGQGLKAAQAAAAARGLGVSGASLKGAATYATGLADATYANRFNEAQQSWQDVINQGQSALNLGTSAQNAAAGYGSAAQIAQQMQQQQYGQWANIANLGENAAAQTGQAATAAGTAMGSGLMTGAGQAGNYLTQAGQAQAAGTVGVGSAVNQGVNNYLGYQAYQNALQPGGQGTFAGSQMGGFVGGTNLPFTGIAAGQPGQVYPGGFTLPS